jgi:amidohydrolase
MIKGGIRNNIIPDKVTMLGTIRALDKGMQKEIHERIKRTAENIAESAGATATVTIETGYPVVFNDPAVTERAAPVLRRHSEEAVLANAVLGAEDFSFFQEQVPGLFFWVGTRPKSQNAEQAASNHSPLFFIDESGLITGVRSLAALAVEFLK